MFIFYLRLNLNVDQDNLTDFLYQLADSTYDTFWLMDMDIPEIKADNYLYLTYEVWSNSIINKRIIFCYIFNTFVNMLKKC